MQPNQPNKKNIQKKSKGNFYLVSQKSFGQVRFLRINSNFRANYKNKKAKNKKKSKKERKAKRKAQNEGKRRRYKGREGVERTKREFTQIKRSWSTIITLRKIVEFLSLIKSQNSPETSVL